jgi:hypothetical protein
MLCGRLAYKILERHVVSDYTCNSAYECEV